MMYCVRVSADSPSSNIKKPKNIDKWNILVIISVYNWKLNLGPCA